MSKPPKPGKLAGPGLRQRFAVGKYEVVAQPIPGSAQMLRYTVFLHGERIGATASVPTESDCRNFENPPAVPPLKPFRLRNRPGRPRKSAPAKTEEP
jgi:hypothetical protein